MPSTCDFTTAAPFPYAPFVPWIVNPGSDPLPLPLPAPDPLADVVPGPVPSPTPVPEPRAGIASTSSRWRLARRRYCEDSMGGLASVSALGLRQRKTLFRGESDCTTKRRTLLSSCFLRGDTRPL